MTKQATGKPFAQGDFLAFPISAVPETAKVVEPKGAFHIVAHSETGHHHVIDRPKAELYQAADNEFIAYIRTLGDGAEIVHQRAFDTHETIKLPPNTIYEVRRQREYTPEGWRRAAD